MLSLSLIALIASGDF